MRYLCLLLCVFALFPSCKESEKDKIARLVEEWEGKEILFPTHSIFTIQGKDTVDFSLADADYKVVTYIDSVGCVPVVSYNCLAGSCLCRKLIQR